MAKKKDKDEGAVKAPTTIPTGDGARRAFAAALANATKKFAGTVVKPDANLLIKKIVLGSPQLNYMFSGFSYNRIHQFQGPESSGKSSICTYIAGQIQKLFPTRPMVAYIDFERTFDPNYAEGLGLDISPDKFTLLQPENGEDGFTIVEDFVRSGLVSCVILDSDAAMPTRAQASDEVGKASFGGGARLASDELKRLNIILNKYDCSLLWISQERASMCVDPHTSVIWNNGNSKPRTSSIEEFFKKCFKDIHFTDEKSDEMFDVSKRNIFVKAYHRASEAIIWTKVQKIFRREIPSEYSVIATYFDEGAGAQNSRVLCCAGKHQIICTDANGRSYNPEFVEDLYRDCKAGTLAEKYVWITNPLDADSDAVLARVQTISLRDSGAIDAWSYDMEVTDGMYFAGGILSHNSMYGPAEKATGGNSIRFFASTRNRVRKADTITKDKIDVGIQMNVRNLKNKTGIPWRVAKMSLYFDGGFNTDAEYLDFIIMYGLVRQAGAYFKNEELGISCQGREALMEYLVAHPDVYTTFKKKVDELQLVKTDLDANNVDPELTGEAEPDGGEDFSPEALAESALEGSEPPTIDKL